MSLAKSVDLKPTSVKAARARESHLSFARGICLPSIFLSALGGTRPPWRVADKNALARLLYHRAAEVAFHLAHFGQHALKTVDYSQNKMPVNKYRKAII